MSFEPGHLATNPLPPGIVGALGLTWLVSWLDPLKVMVKLPIDAGKLVINGTKITMEAPKLSGYTRDQWKELTSNMIDLDGIQNDVLDYLAANFPPNNQRAAKQVPGNFQVTFKEWVVPQLGQTVLTCAAPLVKAFRFARSACHRASNRRAEALAAAVLLGHDLGRLVHVVVFVAVIDVGRHSVAHVAGEGIFPLLQPPQVRLQGRQCRDRGPQRRPLERLQALQRSPQDRGQDLAHQIAPGDPA